MPPLAITSISIPGVMPSECLTSSGITTWYFEDTFTLMTLMLNETAIDVNIVERHPVAISTAESVPLLDFERVQLISIGVLC